MNKKQKKEPFSLKNMNGQEEHCSSLQDMNATRSRPYRKYHLTDMNGEDGR